VQDIYNDNNTKNVRPPPALRLKIPPVNNQYVTYTLISSADTPQVTFRKEMLLCTDAGPISYLVQYSMVSRVAQSV